MPRARGQGGQGLSPTVSSQSILAVLFLLFFFFFFFRFLFLFFFSFWGLLFRFNCTHQEMPHLDCIQAQSKMSYFQIIFSNDIMSPPASQSASQASQPASQARQPAIHIHPASSCQTASVRVGGRERSLPNKNLPNSRCRILAMRCRFAGRILCRIRCRIFCRKTNSASVSAEQNLPNLRLEIHFTR